MASRRHYFLGCKSWTAYFPHQVLTVIASASTALSRTLVKVVKEGNGGLEERMKEKACSITNLLLTQSQTLGASPGLCRLSFFSSWSSLNLSLHWGWIHSGSLKPLEGMVWKKKTFTDCFQLDSDPTHTCPQGRPCQIAPRARFTPCHAAHIEVELLFSNKFSFPYTWYTGLFFPFPLSPLAT